MTTEQTTSALDPLERADLLLAGLCDHIENEVTVESDLQLAMALCLLDIAHSQKAIARDVIWRGHENSLHRSELGLD